MTIAEKLVEYHVAQLCREVVKSRHGG